MSAPTLIRRRRGNPSQHRGIAERLGADGLQLRQAHGGDSHGWLPEVVEHGETGLLVPPCDEDALADAVIELLRDDDLRRRLGREGHEKLLAEWSPKVVARQTADVHRRAIDDRRGMVRPTTPSAERHAP